MGAKKEEKSSKSRNLVKLGAEQTGRKTGFFRLNSVGAELRVRNFTT